jgi:hypothetical protein
MRNYKPEEDLPGHADEVFAGQRLSTVYRTAPTYSEAGANGQSILRGGATAVDWSPDGEKVASGGRDR